MAAFDPKTLTWSKLPKMGRGRAAATATLMGGCGVVVIGGGSGTNGSATMTQELLLLQ